MGNNHRAIASYSALSPSFPSHDQISFSNRSSCPITKVEAWIGLDHYRGTAMPYATSFCKSCGSKRTSRFRFGEDHADENYVCVVCYRSAADDMDSKPEMGQLAKFSKRASCWPARASTPSQLLGPSMGLGRFHQEEKWTSAHGYTSVGPGWSR